ncbi:MAG: hypothetical protein IT327_32035 [Anaerolineae bacterium]|nr:hypothetical protein [Anaerolineae bacterium]
MASSTSQLVKQLRHHLLRYQNESEIELLVDRFGYDWATLSGSNVSEKLQTCLSQLCQTNRIQELVEFLKINPNFQAWPGNLIDYELDSVNLSSRQSAPTSHKANTKSNLESVVNYLQEHPVPILIVFVLTVIGILFGIYDDSGLREFTTNQESTPSHFTQTPGPTPTVNSHEVQVESLMDPQIKVVEKSIVNLDGAGPDEIIVHYEDTSIENHVSSSSLEELEEREGLIVFSYSGSEGWRPVLRLPNLEAGCGFYFGDYGIVDLFQNESRQLVVWLNCGTGYFLNFEIYQYRGLGFLERIYINEPQDSLTGEFNYQWMESGIYIANEQLFVSHPQGLYQYIWEDEKIVAVENAVDPGPNGVVVEYWVNSDGSLQASQEVVTLKLGQYLYLKQIEGGNYPDDPRIQFSNIDVLSFEAPAIYIAKNIGTTDIYLRPWHDKPMIALSVISQ